MATREEILASLPELRGTPGGDSRIDPTLRPYLGLGLQRAEQLFFGPGPQFFPGQTYVSPSEQTLTALQQQEALARGGQPALQEAQRAFLAGLGPSAAAPLFQDLYGAGARQAGAPMYEAVAGGGFRNLALDPTMQTAAGSFLMGSPYQQALIDQSVRPISQQLSNVTLPGIQSAFSAAGRYGSGAQQRAIGEAVERASRAAGDIATQIGSGTYAQERGFQEAARAQLAGLSQQDLANRIAATQGLEASQQAAFARQVAAAGGLGAAQEAQLARGLTGAQLAPQIFAQQFLPSQQLGQIGAAREQIAGLPLQEEMARFQFGQQVPYQQLQGFLSSVYGTPMSASNIPQAQTNRVGQALGGAVLGGQVGSLFGRTEANPFGYGNYGAILGGLSGLLG